MGVGKTTVGKRVAELLNLPFCDLDERVESSAGRSIPQIFEMSGEAAFRKLESDELRQALRNERMVLALGGGTLHVAENCAFIQSCAHLFCLSLPFSEIEQRIGKVDRGRPLWGASAAHLYETRQPLFSSVGVLLNVSGMSVQHVAEAIVESVSCN